MYLSGQGFGLEDKEPKAEFVGEGCTFMGSWVPGPSPGFKQPDCFVVLWIKKELFTRLSGFAQKLCEAEQQGEGP